MDVLLVQNPVFPQLVPPRLHCDCWVRHGLTNSPIQGQKENTTARPSLCSRENDGYHYGFKFKDNEVKTWPYHYYSFINSWEGNCLYSSNIHKWLSLFTRAFSTFSEFWVISKEAKPQLLLGGELCPSHILCWSRNSQYLRVRPHLSGLLVVRVSTPRSPRQGAGVWSLVRDLGSHMPQLRVQSNK